MLLTFVFPVSLGTASNMFLQARKTTWTRATQTLALVNISCDLRTTVTCIYLALHEAGDTESPRVRASAG